MRKKINTLNENLMIDIMRANYRVKEAFRAKNMTYEEAACRIGVTIAAISSWLIRKIPAARCKQMSDLIDGEVKPIEMRPDIFGVSAYKAAPREKFLKSKEEKNKKHKIQDIPDVIKKFL